MVYLVKSEDGVKVYFGGERILEGVTPDMEITEEEYYAAHGLAKVVDGEIVLGMTPEEKAESGRQMRENEYVQELAAIDREAGAGRAIRAVAFKAGILAGMKEDPKDPDYDEDFKFLCGYERRAQELREKIETLQ
jgi:hypothetical protein